MKNKNKEIKLIYASKARCSCGAGLAYKEDIDYWDCSEILLGIADKKKKHTAKLPFVFWKIKSENQPSANGITTRPKFNLILCHTK